MLLSLRDLLSWYLCYFKAKWHSFILTFFRFMNGSESFSAYLRIQSGVVNWRFLDEYLMLWCLFEEGCKSLHVKPKDWLKSDYGKSKCLLLLYINTVNWINDILINSLLSNCCSIVTFAKRHHLEGGLGCFTRGGWAVTATAQCSP